MKLALAFLALVAVLAAPLAAAADADDKVLVFTDDNFDEGIAANDLTLVEFYAPWCGHCKALAPEYASAAETLDGKDAGVLAKVDCTEHRDVCEKYGVRGFPTLKLFRNDGSEPTDYDQARQADAIVKFMKKANAPAVTDITDADGLKAFNGEDSVTIVAFTADANAEFGKVAAALRNEFSFGQTFDSDLAASESATQPTIRMYRDFDEAVNYEGALDAEDFAEAITAWIRSESFPIVGEIGPENYQKYVERGFNFVWVFVDTDSAEQTTMLEGVITTVAKDFKDKLSFVKLDGVRWAEHAKSFGLSGNTPAIVVEDREKGKNFVFPEDTEVNADEFRSFVTGYLDGTLAPTIKSEPIPESNDGPVTVVVAHTFEDIVLDDAKDVLVEFYAPWCGHCKSLAPKYEELGKLFANEPNVVIAKVDATANDTPAKVQGFPTLILYPAGGSPVDFNGERSVESMAEFIRENGKAVTGASGDAAAGGSEDESKDEL